MAVINFVLDVLQNPFIALFLTLSAGYVLGKIKYKTFVLGGISGSLIMGVIIGQLGIQIPNIIGTIFFALFIYAVGYQGGASFFKSLNRKTLIELISATLTCVLGLLCVLAFAWWFHLDRGTAAGLAAGGLTQSALIGSASTALAQLHLPQSVIHTMQTNVAVGYAVCYIFGSFGPILLLATVFPLLMKWDLRKEAIKLASEQSQGNPALEAGQFHALEKFATRVYRVASTSELLNLPVLTLFAERPEHAAVEALVRDNQLVDVTPHTTLQPDDVVAITAPTKSLVSLSNAVGPEVPAPDAMSLTEETRSCILANRAFHNKSLQAILNAVQAEQYYGVFIQEVIRFGDKLPLSKELKLKRGDELKLVGTPKDLDRVNELIGKKVSAEPITDFIFFGLGMVLGFLLGLITFHIFGVSITLGSGVGCLLSGLIFGWIQSVKPQYAAFPAGASNFLRDFGLAVFVSVIGLTAGPQAITAIEHSGLELFFMGMGVTLIPQILTFFISYYLLRIKNPIQLLSTIAGGRSANPGFAALLDKAGNATPVIPFTATYALANIWLTLWGPVIVALVTKNIAL